MKVRKKLLTIILLLGVLLVSTISSYAYVLAPAKQSSTNVRYYWESSMTSAWKVSFLTAMDYWYDTPTLAQFTYDSLNKVNSMFVFYNADNGLYGRTYRYWYDNTLIYYRVRAGANYQACQGHTSYFINGVIVHELGHLYGLEHTDSPFYPYPIMDWYSYAYFDDVFWPQDDDIAGINAKYPWN